MATSQNEKSLYGNFPGWSDGGGGGGGTDAAKMSSSMTFKSSVVLMVWFEQPLKIGNDFFAYDSPISN